jgi:hypothetical protein
LEKNPAAAIRSWGRCFDFKKYFRRKNGNFLTQITANLAEKTTMTLFFKEKTVIFSPKVSENSDQNIDPWSQPFNHELQRQRCKNLQRHC